MARVEFMTFQEASDFSRNLSITLRISTAIHRGSNIWWVNDPSDECVNSNMKQTITENPTTFYKSVGTKSSVTFTGASAVSYPSSVASPSLATTYPHITVTDYSFSFTLKQSGASGTLYWAYKKETANDNNIQSYIDESDFTALTAVTINNTAASVDTDIPITVTDLAAESQYTVYYYGQNNGLPKIKTPIYSQIIITNWDVKMRRYGFMLIFAIIMVVLF